MSDPTAICWKSSPTSDRRTLRGCAESIAEATMAEQAKLTGPDFGVGVDASSVREAEPMLGHANGEPILLVRRGADVLAIGAACTHYGGPLAEGLVAGDEVRCPWHHACFSLRTGEALRSPALSPVACWK